MDPHSIFSSQAAALSVNIGWGWDKMLSFINQNDTDLPQCWCSLAFMATLIDNMIRSHFLLELLYQTDPSSELKSPYLVTCP